MGYALAEKARDMGGEVVLVSGPVSLAPIPEVTMVYVESANEMEKVIIQYSSHVDYIFMAAAVSDYIPVENYTEKIKRSDKVLKLDLKPAPDILKSIKNKTSAIITAFALETHNGEEEAKRKLKEKNVDFIILNYANEKGAGFDSNTNHVYIYNKNGEECEIKKDTKDASAEIGIFITKSLPPQLPKGGYYKGVIILSRKNFEIPIIIIREQIIKLNKKDRDLDNFNNRSSRVYKFLISYLLYQTNQLVEI